MGGFSGLCVWEMASFGVVCARVVDYVNGKGERGGKKEKQVLV